MMYVTMMRTYNTVKVDITTNATDITLNMAFELARHYADIPCEISQNSDHYKQMTLNFINMDFFDMASIPDTICELINNELDYRPVLANRTIGYWVYEFTDGNEPFTTDAMRIKLSWD